MRNFEPYTAPYKDQYFGGPYGFIKEKAIYESFLAQIREFDLGISFRNNLEMIFRTRYWEKVGFDGKTLIKDSFAGNISSFFHDYPSRMGFGCYENDVIFLYLELKGGSSKTWALTQFYVVRATTPVFNLRDRIIGRRIEKPQWLLDLYNEVSARLYSEFNLIY